MPRIHLMEIGDQPWCPGWLRDTTTDLLELILRRGNYYAPAVPRLIAALQATGATEVIDLCSGGGGPWPGLLPQFGQDAPRRVLLTDKFPNPAALARLAAADGRIVPEPRSIDVTAVPDDLRGFRTLFTSFHHFRPAQAQAILADATRSGTGIGVFEFTHRGFIAITTMIFTPVAALLLVPFVRPFRWSSLLFTYLLPVIPLGAMSDGIVSCLRTYSPRELTELVKPLQSDEYVWEIGQERTWRSPIPITYLIGYPRPRSE